MDTTLNIAVVFLPLLYLLVTVGYGFLFFANDSRARRVAPPLFYATLALHFGYLVLLAIRWHQFPMASVSQAFSAVAFAVAVVYAFVEWHGREASTGFLMLFLASVFEILSSVFRTSTPPDREIFHSPLFAAHTSFGLLGYTAFMVAAAYGFLFLRLYREIKRRRFSVFFGQLPPLEVLERMMMGAILVGIVALSGTLVTGSLWAKQMFQDRAWWSDSKVLTTFAIWAFYGVALLLRRAHRLQGRQLALASVLGVAAILFSLIGINLFLTDLHDFM